MSAERLQKIIAHSGFCSRRAAETLILEGKVSLNGVITKELGIKADSELDIIEVLGKRIANPDFVVYVLNKPKGVVTSKKKQFSEKIVMDLIPKTPDVFPIGRLDKDSEGLLLLTNNGNLAHTLTHPSFAHTKVYKVVIISQKKHAPRTAEWIEHQLLKGVKLGDGLAKADQITVKELPEDEFELTLSVHEGRNHLIRRMCATIGFDVSQLKRIKLGPIRLSNLKSGQYRILTKAEITSLT